MDESAARELEGRFTGRADALLARIAARTEACDRNSEDIAHATASLETRGRPAPGWFVDVAVQARDKVVAAEHDYNLVEAVECGYQQAVEDMLAGRVMLPRPRHLRAVSGPGRRGL